MINMDTPIRPRDVMAKLGSAPINRICDYCCTYYAESGLGEGGFSDEDEEREAVEELEEHCANCPLIWTEFFGRNTPRYEWKSYPANVPPEPGRYLVKFSYRDADPGDEEDTLYWNGTDWRLYTSSSQSIGTVAAWTRYPKCPKSVSGN